MWSMGGSSGVADGCDVSGSEFVLVTEMAGIGAGVVAASSWRGCDDWEESMAAS